MTTPFFLLIIKGFRKQVFIVAGFGQRYQPAMPQQLAQLSEAPLPLPHMDHNGQLKSDFELGIDQLLIGDVLLPAVSGQWAAGAGPIRI